MPARDRAPEPLARPSSTVSAWSSRVCPRATDAAPAASAVSARAAYLASLAAPSGPWYGGAPGRPPRRANGTGTRTPGSSRSALRVALYRGGPPPLHTGVTDPPAAPQATPGRPEGERRREGERVGAPRARCQHQLAAAQPGEAAAHAEADLRDRRVGAHDRSARDSAVARDPLQPEPRTGDLFPGGQRLRRCPHPVEGSHPGFLHDCLDEPRPLLVLLHLQVNA